MWRQAARARDERFSRRHSRFLNFVAVSWRRYFARVEMLDCRQNRCYERVSKLSGRKCRSLPLQSPLSFAFNVYRSRLGSTSDVKKFFRFSGQRSLHIAGRESLNHRESASARAPRVLRRAARGRRRSKRRSLARLQSPQWQRRPRACDSSVDITDERSCVFALLRVFDRSVYFDQQLARLQTKR